MTEPRRFPLGPLLAGAAAVLLLVSLFLDWYGEYTAWTMFEVLDLLLAAIAIAALVALARELGLGALRSTVIGVGALLPLAFAAVVIVTSQLLNHPPAADDLDKEAGVWLALAASLVMLAGAVLAVARISLALDVEPRPDSGSDPEAPTVERPERPGEPGP